MTLLFYIAHISFALSVENSEKLQFGDASIMTDQNESKYTALTISIVLA